MVVVDDVMRLARLRRRRWCLSGRRGCRSGLRFRFDSNKERICDEVSRVDWRWRGFCRSGGACRGAGRWLACLMRVVVVGEDEVRRQPLVLARLGSRGSRRQEEGREERQEGTRARDADDTRS